MKITQTPNELTIQETPGCLWFFGLFFVIIGGILIYGTLGGFSNWNEVPAWQLVLAFFIAVSVVSGGVWVISGAPITKVVINRIEDSVSIIRYGFFGKRVEFYSFSEIKIFCLIEEIDTESEPIWYIGMTLQNGEKIKISSMALHSEDIQRKYVFETNEFMRKQMPSYNTDLIE